MEELRLDIQEYESLLEQAARPKVKDGLTLQLKKLQTELIRLQDQNSNQNASATPTPIAKTTRAPTKVAKKINTYGWDQSDKFMKIYVTEIKGIKDLPAENITSEFTDGSFKARITTADNVTHEVHVAYLWDKIIPDKCYHKAKTDMLLLMLKKTNEGKTWAFVTEEEGKQKARKEAAKKKDTGKKDPEAGMMDLMRQMYEDGDDEMKRTIAKAYTQGNDKKDKSPAGPEDDDL